MEYILFTTNSSTERHILVDLDVFGFICYIRVGVLYKLESDNVGYSVTAKRRCLVISWSQKRGINSLRLCGLN